MRNKPKNENALYFIGLLAWLIPGAGHWLLGHKNRAAIIFVAICSTFLFGILLGSIDVIDPQQAKAWFCAQVLCGLPTIITTILAQKLTDNTLLDIFGRSRDIGQVYLGVAGLLNLLCILDALYRTHLAANPDPS
jgi:TM2 domain-containing membrane protein YozV